MPQAVFGFSSMAIAAVQPAWSKSANSRAIVWPPRDRLARRSLDAEVGEVEVAVVLSSGPLLRQALVGHHLETDGRDARPIEGRRYRVSVHVGPRTTEPHGMVRAVS